MNEVIVPELTIREKVNRLEGEIQKLPQVEIPLVHYFAPGLYLREMQMPKFAVLTGAVHKTEHICILSKGHVQVVTDEGVLDLVAPATIHSMPGAKRAIVALEDSVWTNIHHNPDNIQDPDILTEILTESKASELLGGKENKQILINQESSITIGG
jgi:hypothetical protein